MSLAIYKNNCLIGHTGFIGQYFKRNIFFKSLFNSKNIKEINNKNFDVIICAGAPATKWLANKKPLQDRNNIGVLMKALEKVETKKFILISTVDVFSNPVEVDEESEINLENLNSYGLHRFELERFIINKFPNHLIVRLPGLVGKGLKKNILFDLHNNNEINKIDSRNIFQFYNLENLYKDILKAINLEKKLIHFTSEPLSVREICLEVFGFEFENKFHKKPFRYDFRTKYGLQMGVNSFYNYTKKETLDSLKHYVNNEPKRI